MNAASPSVRLATEVPDAAVALHVATEADFDAQAATLPEATRRWLHTQRFRGAGDAVVPVPAADGRLASVWLGVRDRADPWALSRAAQQLPAGDYRLAEPSALDLEAAAHGWALGTWRYTRYRANAAASPVLHLPNDARAARGLRLAQATAAVRDWVTTPAEDFGPADLADAVRAVALRHGAAVREVVGDDLLAQGLPAIHAVGRAAAPDRAPRLIELTWGDAAAPRLALVGKGVCFDTGGLDIKTGEGMRWMKKDMGGAANALALADLVMAERLPVRLHLLVPAVENAIAGGAMRPGDVFRTRKGLSIEIGNTDAEGRVILCDALALACEPRDGDDGPEMVIDFATLTGAARIALGADLPALFCRHTALARSLVDLGEQLRDPVWHMPLWAPYRVHLDSEIADLSNNAKTPKGGAITAALFLADFVPPSVAWVHLDLYAWNDAGRPGRPAGGEMQSVRTLLAMARERWKAG